MSAPAFPSDPPRWLVMAKPWGRHRCYLLYQTGNLPEARWVKALAQRWLDDLCPDQLWLISLHVLAETS